MIETEEYRRAKMEQNLQEIVETAVESAKSVVSSHETMDWLTVVEKASDLQRCIVAEEIKK